MSLRRELGLRDLTLFSIACIVGTRWIASAAHAGSGSILIWLLAAVFFLIPLAVTTATLTARHPVAGGLYIWTRGDFGPWHGFLAFWVYWMGIAFWFPSAALFYVSVAVTALGPRYEHLSGSRAFLLAGSLAAIWIALGTNIVGVKIGKWTENVGAGAAWLLGMLLVAAAWFVWKKRGAAAPIHLVPGFSWDTLNFLATIAFALTGFEMAGFMGAEIRDPARDLPRAAWISSIFATAFYGFATLAMLVLLRPESISEINGLSQAAAEAGGALGAPWLPPVIAVLVLTTAVGQFGGLGASVSRMPFAAGVDSLLPAVFAKVHPRWATPHISMLTLGALASALLIAVQFGDTIRATYQTLVSLMVITGFLPFVYMFASGWKAGRKWSAISGWSVTALAIFCSLVPTAEIHNVWLFEGKLAAGTVAVVVSAWLVYRRKSALPSGRGFHE